MGDLWAAFPAFGGLAGLRRWRTMSLVPDSVTAPLPASSPGQPGGFASALQAHQAQFRSMGRLEAEVQAVAERLAACLGAGGKLLIGGQAASAALSRHLGTWLAGNGHRPLAVLALSSDGVGSACTADEVFSRQIEALGRPGDALLVICAGDGGAALKRAADRAGERGLLTVGLLATGSRGLAESCHLAIVVPGGGTARVLEAQQFVGHVLCDLVETALLGD